MENMDAIIAILEMIRKGQKQEAVDVLEKNCKHKRIKYEKRKMSCYEKMRLFIRDGFIDRYSGKRLLFPNVLRVISLELGAAFPFHPNWKMSDCHVAYWYLSPTYDHVIPIARGGKDIDSNIVTTSQMMNSAKSNFLIEEIGFSLYPPGSIEEWDGMISWYKGYIKDNPQALSCRFLATWHVALKKYEKEIGEI